MELVYVFLIWLWLPGSQDVVAAGSDLLLSLVGYLGLNRHHRFLKTLALARLAFLHVDWDLLLPVDGLIGEFIGSHYYIFFSGANLL